MRVLITGGSGLIGYEVSRMLIERGREVISLSRRLPEGERLAGVQYVTCDLNDYVRLFSILKETGVTEILHAGGVSGPMVDVDNPWNICHTNLNGTVNIYEAARMFNVRRVVYASSESVYGTSKNGPLTEESVLRPSTVYAVTKASCDLLGAVYSNRYGLDVVSLRIGWVYGPRRTTDCLIREMLKDALAGRVTRMDYGADQPYPFIYVKDSAKACVAALETPRLQQRAYNITSGEATTVAEVADAVRKAVPGTRIEVGTGIDPNADQQAPQDISAAARDLGWRPEYTLERGIAEYADWLRARQSKK